MKEFAEQSLQVRQKPLTEGLLRTYLAKAGIKEDTVYALMYIPTYCRRCEIALTNFGKMLKEVSPKSKLMIISVYKDAMASSNYNKEKEYTADYYLYDTTNEYKSIFSLNYRNSLFGTYLMKLDVKNGRMVIGGISNLLSTEFVSQMVNFDKPLEPMTFANEEMYENQMGETTAVVSTAKPISQAFDEYTLVGNSPVSEIYGTPVFENGTMAFNDQFATGVMLFGQKGKVLEYKGTVRVDSLEKRKYINLSDESYQHCLRNKSFFYMPRSPLLLNDTTLAVSYSVPNVSETANEITFYNKPLVITRDTRTLEKGRIYEINSDMLEKKYMYHHHTLDMIGGRVITGVVKQTWPMEYKREEYEHNVEMNPFDDRCYDTPSPIAAAFSPADGTVESRFGHFEDWQRKTRTGYYFYTFVGTHHGDKLLYGNAYSGRLYMADSSDLTKEERGYTVFEIDAASLPEPDSTMFYKPEYAAPYSPFFNRLIEVVKMNSDEIVCIVRHKPHKAAGLRAGAYDVVRIDRRTGERTERSLPSFEGYELLAWGIRREGEKLSPFAMLKRDGKCTLRVYTGS